MSSSIADEITCRRGFTLMEVMIGMLLLAMVVGASGVAMVHFSQRTGDARLAVTDLQQQQRFIQIITDDLARLKDITSSTTTTIVFTIDLGAGGENTITYTWTGPDTGTFSRRLGTNTPVILSDNIKEFELEYQTLTRNNEQYVCGFLINITWNDASEDNLVRTIELTNPILIEELPAIVTMIGGTTTTTTTSTVKTFGTYFKTK